MAYNNRMEKAAEDFCQSIKALASKPENLANLEIYLTYNFQRWLEKYANTPEGIAAEMKEFANMQF